MDVSRVWGALEGTGLHGWHVWVIFGLGLFILEMIIPGFLVACFGVGCLASALVAALDGSFSWQLVAFAVATLLVYFTIRPLFLKHFYSKVGPIKTNVHALVGKVGVVIHALDPDSKAGRVKVRGEDWRGVPVDNVVIEEGEKIEVVAVDGTKLLVKLVTKS